MLEGQTCAERVFKVRHTDEQLETELCTIVVLGGQVKNVMVNDKVYGHIQAELGITSPKKVKEFLADIESGKSTPLKNITSDYHYHTVTADSEETLGLIEKERRKLDFWLKISYQNILNVMLALKSKVYNPTFQSRVYKGKCFFIMNKIFYRLHF